MVELGLIPSLNDNDDIKIFDDASDSELEIENLEKDTEFNNNFRFEDSDNDGIYVNITKKAKLDNLTSLDQKIKKRRSTVKTQIDDSKNTNEIEEGMEIDNENDSDDRIEKEITTVEIIDTVKLKEKKKKKSKLNPVDEKIKYSDIVSQTPDYDNFSDMDLSRPIYKALHSLLWTKPTPIQGATIGPALMGRDICACAATGTGKTGAFMIPVLERLLHKPNKQPITRVLVLTPTRELAVQIFEVTKQLSQYIQIDMSLATGGLDRNSQEATLRLGPDIVIATLGRLIDHLQNAPNFNLNSIEILILDEADRMLDEYFSEQMKEVLLRCSPVRQTMLFSATMTEKVKDLARLSLKNPIRIFVNENHDVAINLHQEFVRIRPNHEGDREAIVAALVKRTFKERCIIFIQTKKEAHRLHIILGLLGVKVGELHGNLSQLQRLDALKNFKNGDLDILIATDLVARGLDIENVKTVINMTMPSSLERYIHRVGRTARAGKAGRSVSLVGEKERSLLAQVIKATRIPVKSRIVPPEVVVKYRSTILKLESSINEIEAEEEEDKELRMAEAKANKATKLILHNDEIKSRPKRTWFQTHKERLAEKEELTGALNKNLKKSDIKKLKTVEDRMDRELQKASDHAARSLKRSLKPKRLKTFDDDEEGRHRGGQIKKNKKEKSTDCDSALIQLLCVHG